MQGNKANLLNRLKKEQQDLEKNYSNILNLNIVDNDNLIWEITFKGAEGSLYAGEQYTL